MQEKAVNGGSLASVSTSSSPGRPSVISTQTAVSAADDAPGDQETKWETEAWPSETRYNHYENAEVYVYIAFLTFGYWEETNGGTSSTQRYDLFAAEPTDPHPNTLARRLAAAIRCKYPIYVLALLYLRQLRHTQSQATFSEVTFQRYVMAAAIVATKFYDDHYFSNERYARELGVQLPTLNAMEISFLVLKDFDLKVDSNVFHQAMRDFDDIRVQYCERRESPCWSGLKMARCPVNVATLSATHWKESLPSSIVKKSDLCSFLQLRSIRGFRYETEEERLYKVVVNNSCKKVAKLLEECSLMGAK